MHQIAWQPWYICKFYSKYIPGQTFFQNNTPGEQVQVHISHSPKRTPIYVHFNSFDFCPKYSVFGHEYRDILMRVHLTFTEFFQLNVWIWGEIHVQWPQVLDTTMSCMTENEPTHLTPAFLWLFYRELYSRWGFTHYTCHVDCSTLLKYWNVAGVSIRISVTWQCHDSITFK